MCPVKKALVHRDRRPLVGRTEAVHNVRGVSKISVKTDRRDVCKGVGHCHYLDTVRTVKCFPKVYM